MLERNDELWGVDFDINIEVYTSSSAREDSPTMRLALGSPPGICFFVNSPFHLKPMSFS